MATLMQLTTGIFSSFLFIIFFSPLASSSPDAYCNNTPFPSFCQSILPNNGSATTIYDYGRLSIQLSLSSTKFFLSLIDTYLRLPHTVSNKITIQALQDCQFLSDLNVDFLSNTLQTISSTDTLHRSDADDLHTLLSATITNQQTCSDSLQTAYSSSAVIHALLPLLSNGTMINSVSLALFIHGWVDDEGKNGRWLAQRYFTLSEVKVRQRVIVDKNGKGNFTTISDAVAAVPNNTVDGYFVIYVVAGIYEEYVDISKKKQNLMMIGDGINQTIITGNRSVADGLTTFNTATFAVLGQGFVAVNITFRNTAGPIKHQAVAVRNGADQSTFYKCSFEGYQDTLYTHSLRQFYKNCDIYGTVDFIFGDAAAVFQDCNIYPRLPMQKQFNAITAQGRSDMNENTGISIHFCTIKAAPDLAAFTNGTIQTFLGRPWKEYSRTVYMQSFIDDLVDPEGWRAWEGDFALNTLYYAEYNNTGRGSDTTNRVKWAGYRRINATDANNFTVSNFILGEWLPATQVPYMGGLS